jgi:hypothetical protein
LTDISRIKTARAFARHLSLSNEEAETMLVSNFVLGYHHDFWPWEPTWTAGYTLQITNLAGKEIEFGVECWVTSLSFGADTSGYSDETLLTQFVGRHWYRDYGGHYYAYESTTIPANGSWSWQLAPFKSQSRQYTHVRGYVSLRVPVVRSPRPPQKLAPQSAHPVPVLLSAWRQDGWDKLYGLPDVDILSRSQSALQLATGKAHNEIPPDTSLYVHPKWASQYLTGMATAAGIKKAAQGALVLQEENAAQALLDLLNELGGDEGEIEAVNKALREWGAPVSVQLNRDGG